jgi:hypothetical protein
MEPDPTEPDRTRPDPNRPGRAADFGWSLHAAGELAAHSPSSHNCQPWALGHAVSAPARREAARALRCADDGDRQFLTLALDRGRALRALPAHDLEMLLSCGSYWRILVRALDAFGWQLDRDEAGVSPSSGWYATRTPLRVAAFRWVGHRGAPEFDALAALVGRRRTNRAPYHPAALPVELLDALAATPGPGQVGVTHLRTRRDRTRCAALVARFGGRDFGNLTAWRETHSYLRRDAAQATRRGDGFTLEQLFGPLSGLRRLALRVALAPRVMAVLRGLGYHHVLAVQLARVVRATPTLAIVSIADEQPDPGDVVAAGGFLADYWLRATELGLVLHPVSVMVQHDDVRRRLESAFGVPGRALFLTRLGRPTTGFPAPPRRAVPATRL